jgi:hypothetical protein
MPSANLLSRIKHRRHIGRPHVRGRQDSSKIMSSLPMISSSVVHDEGLPIVARRRRVVSASKSAPEGCQPRPPLTHLFSTQFSTVDGIRDARLSPNAIYLLRSLCDQRLVGLGDEGRHLEGSVM